MTEFTYQRVVNLRKQIADYSAKYQSLYQTSQELAAQIRQLDQNRSQVYPTYQAIFTRNSNLEEWQKQVQNIQKMIIATAQQQQPLKELIEIQYLNDQYGEITAANIDRRLIDASGLLAQYDNEANNLQTQRENILNSCRQLQNEISAIKQDMLPIKTQTEVDTKRTRENNHKLKKQITESRIQKYRKLINFKTGHLEGSNKTIESESLYAISKQKYISQKNAITALNYSYSLFNPVGQSTDLQKDHSDEITNMIDKIKSTLPLPPDHKNIYKESTELTNVYLNDRDKLIDQIDHLMKGLDQIKVIENKALAHIDTYQTQYEINSFEQKKLKEECKQIHQQNDILQEEIENKNKIIAEQQKYIKQIEEENKRMENYSSIDKQTIQDHKLKLNELREQQKQSQENYQRSNTLLQTKSNELLEKFSQFKTLLGQNEFAGTFDKLYNGMRNKINEIMSQMVQREKECQQSQKILEYQLSYAHHLMSKGNLSPQNRITNLEFINYINPDSLTVTKLTPGEILIIETAAPHFACNSLFYPENVDDVYPFTLFTALIYRKEENNFLMHFSTLEKFVLTAIQKFNSKEKLVIKPESESIKEKLIFGEYPLNKVKPEAQTIDLIFERTLSYLRAIMILSPKMIQDDNIKSDVSNLIKQINNTRPSDLSQEILNAYEPTQQYERSNNKTILRKRATGKQSELNQGRLFEQPPYTERTINFRPKEVVNNKDLTLIYNLTISDNDFCAHFNYYHFILYREITIEDLISFFNVNMRTTKPPKSINDFFNEQKRIKTIIKHQLNGNNPKAFDAFSRWLNIAEKALETSNFFLFSSILEGSNESKISEILNTNDNVNNKMKEIANEKYSNLKSINGDLSQMRQLYADANTSYKIPDISQALFIKKILNNEELKENSELIQMKSIRDVAIEAQFFLMGQNSPAPSFEICKELYKEIVNLKP
ncbi:hypothetical protein GPJ56_001391 [Histomonas meleagridis]|uniref:uncharacterized protein n=1 Tax=Histomonas meleagridis TaxID=135588 RepID=UPI00355A4414|nr:hypothetical protein GPJ56_001391 [Histomonas meleagridis]KAH0798151.1 hypothetical protein GO595_008997 [Histomonas meleagridis]